MLSEYETKGKLNGQSSRYVQRTDHDASVAHPLKRFLDSNYKWRLRTDSLIYVTVVNIKNVM